MRNLSFARTTEQIRNRTKTVTRRKGTWWASVLKPGDRLCAVEKAQGIKKGGLVRLCVIRVVSTRLEVLGTGRNPYGTGGWWPAETEAEGFPGMHPSDFIAMFCRHMRCTPDQVVTRIEFDYVRQAPDLGLIGTTCTNFACAHEAEELHDRGLCRCACHGDEAFR